MKVIPRITYELLRSITPGETVHLMVKTDAMFARVVYIGDEVLARTPVDQDVADLDRDVREGEEEFPAGKSPVRHLVADVILSGFLRPPAVSVSPGAVLVDYLQNLAMPCLVLGNEYRWMLSGNWLYVAPESMIVLYESRLICFPFIYRVRISPGVAYGHVF